MRSRPLASLALAGLLVACDAFLQPAPIFTPEPSGATSATPTSVTFAPQATSPVIGAIAGSWARKRDIPSPRMGAATFVFEDRIIVVGGVGKPSAVERYDPGTDQWDRLVDFPYDVEQAMGASIEEGVDAGIFVFGGITAGKPTARVFYLPRDDDHWRELNPMPQARAGGAAVTIGTKVYIVGGASQTTQGVQALALPTLVYDLHGQALAPWTVKAAIPTPRDQLAATEVGGKVCALGGRQFAVSRNLTAFECYDPASDKWEAMPPLPAPRGGGGAATVGDKVVLVGGDEPSGTIGKVHVFRTNARSWDSGPDMPSPRAALGVVAVKNVVYAIGGGVQATKTLSGSVDALTLR